MEDMTGWWAWRGIRGGHAGDAAPARQGYARPEGEDGDIADGSPADDDGAEAGGRGPARRGGPDEASNGIPAKLRTAPVRRLPQEPSVPRVLRQAADWSWRLLLVG